MRFAIVTRDELWHDGMLREERLSWGEAVTRDGEIIAKDTLDEELALLTRPSDTPSLMPGEGMRRVISARRVGRAVMVETIITVRRRDVSVVTTPEHFREHVSFLREIPLQAELSADYRELPILWRMGSAAVLLHEAAGHPAEHGKEPVEWPAWLSVIDDPAFEIDDTGRATHMVDLLRGEAPSAMRRASFTDVPIRRLSNVVVRHRGATIELPEPRIDVFLAGGGAYDALTDLVTVHVSVAAVTEDGQMRRVEPFTIRESRAAVARAIIGAEGEAQPYPGVICSSEGQEIAVGSHAPLMLTRF